MKKSHIVLLLINLSLLIGFGVLFIARLNYEFIIYVGVIILLLGLVGVSINHVDYTLASLLGLTVWSALHLAGGGIAIEGSRLYDAMLFRLSDTYPILRYDQLVHIWGFGASTLVAFSLLSRLLQQPVRHPVALGIILVMAGLGMGALNEILEFIVSACVPQSGVGGYINTSLDLCADLAGALLGWLYIRLCYLGRQAPLPQNEPEAGSQEKGRGA